MSAAEEGLRGLGAIGFGMAAEEVLGAAKRFALLLSQGMKESDVLRAAYRWAWGCDPPAALDPGDPRARPRPEGWRRTVLSGHVMLVKSLRDRGYYRSYVLTVEGPFGSGKTSYVYNSLLGVFSAFAGPDTAKAMVEECFFWDLREWANRLLEMQKRGEWAPVHVLDDVGVHASSYWWFEKNRSAFIRLAEQLDMVKDLVGVLVITTPTERGIASFLRRRRGLVGTLRLLVYPGLAATQVIWHKTGVEVGERRFRRREQPEYVEALPPFLRVPDDFWARLMAARSAAREERLTQFIRELEGAGEGEGGEDDEALGV